MSQKAGYSSTVIHARPATPIPYIFRTSRFWASPFTSKTLILLASPTGFEPVLPP